MAVVFRELTTVAMMLLLLLEPSSSLPATGASGSTCEAAKSLMTSLKLTPSVELPLSPVTGGGGLVCSSDPSERTCCPAAVETLLRHSAASDLHQAVRRSSQPLRLVLAQSASTIQGQIIQSVKFSMSKTQIMFGQLYQRLSLLAHAPVRQLFDRLERFVSKSGDGEGDPADVSDAVAAFFDDLFPRLHGQSPRTVNQGPPLPANTLGLKLNQDYVDCLRHAQSELRPFGEIPRRLANSLARSLDAVRALLSALDLGVQVLNATDHAELNGQCRDALLRATYCAQCRGGGLGSEFRVCNGLCSNVARGCLAGVADVDQPWNEWVDALERLTSTLLNNVNKDSAASTTASDLRAQDVLSSVDSRLSEAILYALENGPLLEKKVKKICGEGQNSTGASGLSVSSAEEEAFPAATPLESSEPVVTSGQLTSGLESLLPALASARGFYANLPDAVCSQSGSPFAHSGQQMQQDDDETNCWNGQRFAEYTKPISGIGIGAQKYNAEVRVSRSDVDSQVVQLSDRLRHVRQVLMSKTTTAPEQDSLVMADFGSGSGDGANSNGVSAGGAGTGRSGSWVGTDSESDGEDRPGGGSDHTFTDADLDGSGSGSGPSDGDWSGSRHNNQDGHKTKKPGADEFELGGGESTPTRGTSSIPASGSGGNSSPHRTTTSLAVLCFSLAASYSSCSIRRFLL